MKRAGEIGGISTSESYASLQPGNRWYVGDMGRIYGPMSWNDIQSMAERAQITPYAHIREESWPQWAPIGYYIRVKTQSDLEIEGLLPSRYDAMFFAGVFLFIIGIIGLIVQPLIGIPLLIFSLVIEILAIRMESQHKGKAITRSIGNAIAILWIILQVAVTIFIIISIF